MFGSGSNFTVATPILSIISAFSKYSISIATATATGVDQVVPPISVNLKHFSPTILATRLAPPQGVAVPVIESEPKLTPIVVPPYPASASAVHSLVAGERVAADPIAPRLRQAEREISATPGGRRLADLA